MTGNTIELIVEDPRTGRGVSGLTCTLYEYNTVVISGYTVSGTVATPLVGTGSSISGTTDYYGALTLDDVAPGVYTVVGWGVGYAPQVLTGYDRIEVSPLIRGAPDKLQLHDSGGTAWYVSVSIAGVLSASTGLT